MSFVFEKLHCTHNPILQGPYLGKAHQVIKLIEQHQLIQKRCAVSDLPELGKKALYLPGNTIGNNARMNDHVEPKLFETIVR